MTVNTVVLLMSKVHNNKIIVRSFGSSKNIQSENNAYREIHNLSRRFIKWDNFANGRIV